ncbi:hypothetical protein Nepgr_033940 [Nepenthes gracilis]|uniref:Uncharacterized protein n=1 Tax=Nepenthes gracilis TaxID=150966 RepID=A0AAD3TMQ1_NEPGR|nr:hypothetical protein Nepgr_033940 [Nepenthes gracilis]
MSSKTAQFSRSTRHSDPISAASPQCRGKLDNYLRRNRPTRRLLRLRNLILGLLKCALLSSIYSATDSSALLLEDRGQILILSLLSEAAVGLLIEEAAFFLKATNPN